ncbi:MAG: translation initiation factor IF-2 subunit alpha [Candidatus Thermoplasmatota archaeon]|nr:translation initiation factor IF-2 subunit alpha [Candidatus Thermoplasmatota archaeon]
MVQINEVPEEGELVVATVRQVKNFGVVVDLDEYQKMEGFIHIAEVASGWVKYIRDHVREGQKVVCKVLGIDHRRRTKYVDLSLKAVNDHQKREKIQQWKSEQKAEKLLELIATQIGTTFEDAMKDFGTKLIQEYDSLYKAFEMTAIKEGALQEDGFEGEWVAPFIKMALENITPPYVQINGVLELTSSNPRGLDEIKGALEKAEKVVALEEDIKLNILYIGSPRFRLILEAPDYKTAEEVLRSSAEAALDNIRENGGEGQFIRNKDGKM